MPRVLLNYARHAYVRKPGTLGSGTRAGNPVGKILALVEAGHGQSFTGYKQVMLIRRIERRMGLLNMKNSMNTPNTCGAMRRSHVAAQRPADRCHRVFSRPRGVEGAGHRSVASLDRLEETRRADPGWVAGVGTGEEAYTLAMLILARQRQLRKRCVVQISAPMPIKIPELCPRRPLSARH